MISIDIQYQTSLILIGVIECHRIYSVAVESCKFFTCLFCAIFLPPINASSYRLESDELSLNFFAESNLKLCKFGSTEYFIKNYKKSRKRRDRAKK